MKFTERQVYTKGLEIMTINNFIKAYNLPFTVEGIGYHIKQNKITWIQPMRDRFVVLSSETKLFYKLYSLKRIASTES